MSNKHRFFLLFEENGQYRLSGQEFVAKTALKAARKAHRANKELLRVFIYDVKKKSVHSYGTEQFLKKKKIKKRNKLSTQ